MPHKDISSKTLSIYRRNLPHFEQGGHWYFVTFRLAKGELNGFARQIVIETILHDHNNRYILAAAVVMPDHVHLLLGPLLSTGKGYFSLGEIMGAIKGVSAKRLNRATGGKGKVWQEEWFDRQVRNEAEWLEKLTYIRANPVKSELVQKPEDYSWLLVMEDVRH